MPQSPAEMLKEYRTEHGLSQRELADALGMSTDALAKWERGVFKVQHPRILELALLALAMQAAAKESVME